MSNSTAELCKSVWPLSVPESHLKSWLIACVLLSPVVILPNALLVFCLVKTNQFGSTTFKLMIGMSICDIFNGIIVLPMIAFLAAFEHNRSCIMKMLAQYLTFLGRYSSLFLLMIIALDRYLHLTKLLKYNLFMNEGRLMKIVTSGFIVANLIALLTVFSPSFYLFLGMNIVNVFGIAVIYIMYSLILSNLSRHSKSLSLHLGCVTDSRVNGVIENRIECHEYGSHIIARSTQQRASPAQQQASIDHNAHVQLQKSISKVAIINRNYKEDSFDQFLSRFVLKDDRHRDITAKPNLENDHLTMRKTCYGQETEDVESDYKYTVRNLSRVIPDGSKENSALNRVVGNRYVASLNVETGCQATEKPDENGAGRQLTAKHKGPSQIEDENRGFNSNFHPPTGDSGQGNFPMSAIVSGSISIIRRDIAVARAIQASVVAVFLLYNPYNIVFTVWSYYRYRENVEPGLVWNVLAFWSHFAVFFNGTTNACIAICSNRKIRQYIRRRVSRYW